ncbi:cytochrome c oxidase assembly protein [Niallia endozanthoxylica]|uniref:Cytochrome c oxidase assembly protein n=1 Tax=Niallia endozanthoxylica TaxID=2036016 RepID=A0A5J5HRA3_9BACI|nr:cytochrome c oxidase assembly protein [Niallia endozanthoxylica]KAA9023834.1 cytochrome c oxidase assembly protein [Niallia endozanthoxylica]
MSIHNHIQHEKGMHPYQLNGEAFEVFIGLFFVLIIIIYLMAAAVSSCCYKKWPLYRSIYWLIGVCCTAAVCIGPLANLSHYDFKAHMLSHLLFGMAAPLFLVLSSPMTLLLRTLKVSEARRLSRILKSRYIRFITDPIVVSILNIGGLWILYTTDLFAMIHDSPLIHFMIHVHVFLAGYFFILSMIGIEPTPHRTSFLYRACVLLIALAFHGILSKYIYVHPPLGVPAVDAEIGAMLMYYGGDAIDAVIIYILCYQWYKASRTHRFFTANNFKQSRISVRREEI